MITSGNPFIKSKVIKACKAIILHIKEERQEREEKVVAPYLLPYKRFNFFGKTITPTYDQAIQSLRSDAFEEAKLFRARWAHDDQLTITQAILTVANKLGPWVNEINLSTEEFNSIARWYRL